MNGNVCVPYQTGALRNHHVHGCSTTLLHDYNKLGILCNDFPITNLLIAVEDTKPEGNTPIPEGRSLGVRRIQ